MYTILGLFLLLVPLLCLDLFIMSSNDFGHLEDFAFWINTIIGIISATFFISAIAFNSWMVIPTFIILLVSCGSIISILRKEGILSKYFRKSIDK